MNRSDFFIPFIDKLAGTDTLRKQIEAGWSEEQIRESWEPGLEKIQADAEEVSVVFRLRESTCNQIYPAVRAA